MSQPTRRENGLFRTARRAVVFLLVPGMPFRDHDYEKLHPEEFPEPDALEPGSEVVPCPHCRQWVYEEAEQCPACGNYLMLQDRTGSKPLWVIVVALFLLIWIILYWI